MKRKQPYDKNKKSHSNIRSKTQYVTIKGDSNSKLCKNNKE